MNLLEIAQNEIGVSSEKGFDGNKRINGRKRHIVVGTLGCILAVVVHRANCTAGKEVSMLLGELFGQQYHRLFKLIADSAYKGAIHRIAAMCFGWMK